jgi:REP element-mobilizing transposase RayT
MADCFSQLYIQIVFAVNGRRSLIDNTWKDELYKYISGSITKLGHKSINVNGMPDHIHLLIGLSPSMAISDLVREIKSNSSKFINEKKIIKGKFNWQNGYGAFSYSRSQIQKVYDYIENQENHHKLKSFREEYLDLLEKFQIPIDNKSLFDFNE